MALVKINKYITLEAENDAGQKSSGEWYCKSLKFKDAEDLKEKASAVNKVLNELNKGKKDNDK